MDFVVEAASALLICGVATLLLRRLGLGERARLAAPLVIVIGLACVLLVDLGWSGVKSMWQIGRADAHLSEATIATERDEGASTSPGFVGWLVQKIPSGQRYYLDGNALYALVLNFSLLPRISVPSPGSADWLIVADPGPGAVPAGYSTPTYYSSGLGLAHRTGAG